jgi:hypothetical protein
MWDFADSREFVLIHHFKIPRIYTWGEKEKDKREEIRRNAIANFPDSAPRCEWYAFSIEVDRSGLERPLDIENVPKLIVDAFSKGIIQKDKSRYPKVGLYPDDDLRHVRAFQIEGKFNNAGRNNTQVQIFGKKAR